MTLTVTGIGQCLPGDVSDEEPASAVDLARRDPSGWFDASERLGQRGYKYLPLSSQLATAAGRQVPGRWASEDPCRRAVWLGTVTGATALHRALDDTIRGEGAEDISPLAAPYFSINLVGGRLASDIVAHGGATTITTPTVALVDALAGAHAAMALGRVAAAMVVSVEVPTPGEEAEDAGAVAFSVRSADGGPHEDALANVDFQRGTWARETLATDLAATVIDLVGPLAARPAGGVDLVVCAVPEAQELLHRQARLLPALEVQLRADVTVVPASRGGLSPAVALAAAVHAGAPYVIAVLGALGHLAAVSVTPRPTF